MLRGSDDRIEGLLVYLITLLELKVIRWVVIEPAISFFSESCEQVVLVITQYAISNARIDELHDDFHDVGAIWTPVGWSPTKTIGRSAVLLLGRIPAW